MKLPGAPIGVLKGVILKLFIILGPLGNLLTPQLVSHSFRTYYLILVFFPIFYIPLIYRQLKFVIYSIPLFLYCFFSAWMVRENMAEEMPLFRFSLLLFQFLFVLGASYLVQDEEEMVCLVILYIKAFFISLVIGYIGYLGFYLKILPLQVLDFFSVLTQIGYGFLRFAPGSYPNEYGIVCSFVLSILTWRLLDDSSLRSFFKATRKFLISLYLLVAGALLLTTTRAAYLSYVFALIYLAWKKGRLRHIFFLIFTLFLGISVLLAICSINIFHIFAVGFDLANLESGSLGNRFSIWREGFEIFTEEPFLGTGFSSQTYLHNFYLQMIFELGIAGLMILLGTGIVYFLEQKYLVFYRSIQNKLLHTFVVLGIIHVIWFAASNHNLNHHLTWFVVFLGLSLANLRRKKAVLS